MTAFTGETFNGGTIDLDGNQFDRCVFDGGVVMTYAGGELPTLTNNQLKNFRVQFTEAAGRTATLLKAMNAPNSGLQEIFRQTFHA